MSNSIFVVGARGIPDVEGGAEKNAERLFPLMVQRGWDVTLVGIEGHVTQASYRGVRLLAAPASRILKTDKLAYYATALAIAAKRRPALVQMQGLGSAIVLAAYKAMGTRTVVRYGSADYLLPKWGRIGRAGFLLAEWQLRWADAVIAVTPALAERLAARGIADNVHVIPNAVDSASEFSDAGETSLPLSPYILAVGRVTEQKNVHRLAEGFALFARDHPDHTLAIAGGVDDPAYLKRLEPFLSERVMLLGRLPRSSLGALYREAAAYVNSSIHEGSSNAVLEAIGWGCPVVVSGIPENRDFKLGEHQYFDPLDPRAIAAALAAAVAEPSRFVPDRGLFLTWDEVADRTAAIYEGLGLAPVRPD